MQQRSSTSANPDAPAPRYIGRLAPSPTGFLHLGHARTFWIAAMRARASGGTLLLRNDDLDHARCRPEFTAAMLEDLRWLGFAWREPMYSQSARIPLHRAALARLHAAGLIYPCHRSRRDVAEAIAAPHEAGGIRRANDHAPAAEPSANAAAVIPADDEPIFPREWRPPAGAPLPPLPPPGEPITTNWRFRVPDDDAPLTFSDNCLGPQTLVPSRDLGDFLVWRRDDMPGYQLACAVDDAGLGITEVVRGADLVKSTFRQLLLLRALGAAAPHYYHCPLMTDMRGQRLAKRHDALALRTLRAQGKTPADLFTQFAQTPM